MIPRIRLKWQLAGIFLALGVLVVGGYSMLAAHYFVRGMDSAMVGSMERAVQHYEAQLANGIARPDVGSFDVTRRWEEQPTQVRQVLPEPRAEGVLSKQHVEDGGRRRGRLYFAARFERADGTLFVSHAISRAQVSGLVRGLIRDNLNTLAVISLVAALALALVTWLVMRRVGKPVSRLAHWARGLGAGNLRDPVPDFRYPELNELAALVRSSLSSLEDSLEREHRFLRHTSHELRTPISVMRNNIELLRALPADRTPLAGDPVATIVDRLDRASLTMKNLTETLLWLGREQADSLPVQPVELDRLLRELAEEHRYLLRDKEVALEITTEPATLDLPDVAARVVIGNLVRNAYQHTFAGEVRIRQHGDTIHIDNRQQDGEDGGDELGFGLGLQLTEQLALRLGWIYRNDPAPGGRQVFLQFTDSGGRG